MSNNGRQVKIKLSAEMDAALHELAKEAGERKIQTVMRQIIAQHLRDQARAAGLDIQVEAPPHPAG